MGEKRRIRDKAESHLPGRLHSANLESILDGLKTLTQREREVLDQVVAGRLNKEIAGELGITIRTVKEHRARVMQKMEADSLAKLVTMIVTLRHLLVYVIHVPDLLAIFANHPHKSSTRSCAHRMRSTMVSG
jgi:DNA-binding NarL/FixJ family response regulator